MLFGFSFTATKEQYTTPSYIPLTWKDNKGGVYAELFYAIIPTFFCWSAIPTSRYILSWHQSAETDM